MATCNHWLNMWTPEMAAYCAQKIKEIGINNLPTIANQDFKLISKLPANNYSIRCCNIDTPAEKAEEFEVNGCRREIRIQAHCLCCKRRNTNIVSV